MVPRRPTEVIDFFAPPIRYRLSAERIECLHSPCRRHPIRAMTTTMEVSETLERVDNIVNMLDKICDHTDGFSSAEEAWLSSITETSAITGCSC